MKSHHALGSAALLGLSVFIAMSCSAEGGDTGELGGPDSGADVPAGEVTCAATEQACGGSCVDTTKDRANCGSCGNACTGTSSCCASRCVAADSCSFYVGTVSPAGGWQNGGDWVTLSGDGFAAGMKVFIGEGRAAVLVLDSKTARIQTPPGPLGATDVRVQLAGKTATLTGAFSYASGDLAGPWEQKPMSVVRGEDPGVAVMQDGRVLVAGGTKVPDSLADGLDSAEIYTRMTDKVTGAKNTMSSARWQNSAVTLLDGKVLVVGGACDSDGGGCKPGSDPKVADLFDPKTDSFAPTKSPMTTARLYTHAVLMVDGRVFISSANDPSIEIYDPKADSFTKLDHAVKHVFGFALRLRDGRVLFGAGDGGVTDTELFDPDTNTFVAAGKLTQGRSKLTAHALPDGRAIVIGGSSKSAGAINDPLDSIELFDPKTNTWSTAPYKLSKGRTWHASALVRDGSILAMGGYVTPLKCDSLDDTVDQIDPVKGTVKPFAVLPNKNTEWEAVTLLDGSVLGVGGGACGTSSALPDLDFLPGKPGPM
ncbi:MAG: kelch repeat-containing protein [Polyangiales bacterium]